MGVPPPAIIRKQLDSNSDTYYCTPAEMERVSSSRSARILNEDGVFVDRDPRASMSSVDSSVQGVRPQLGEGECVCVCVRERERERERENMYNV